MQPSEARKIVNMLLMRNDKIGADGGHDDTDVNIALRFAHSRLWGMVTTVKPKAFTSNSVVLIPALTESISLADSLGTGTDAVYISEAGRTSQSGDISNTNPYQSLLVTSRSIKHFRTGTPGVFLNGDVLSFYPIPSADFYLHLEWGMMDAPDVIPSDSHFLLGQYPALHLYVPLAATRLLMISRQIDISGVNTLIYDVVGEEVGTNVYDRLNRVIGQNKANNEAVQRR